jgi:hypothetical protein
MEYTINDIYKKFVVYNIESGPFNIVHGMVLVWFDQSVNAPQNNWILKMNVYEHQWQLCTNVLLGQYPT